MQLLLSESMTVAGMSKRAYDLPGLSSFYTSYSIVGRLNHEDAKAARPHKPSGQKSPRIILPLHSINQSNSQDHLEFQEKKVVSTLM